MTWFKFYITNRFQSVKLDKVSSDPSSLLTGVPQSSALGSLLFSVYMLPLGDRISRHGIMYHFYADDTQLYL